MSAASGIWEKIHAQTVELVGTIWRSDLVRRYACDPRRLYEIWEGARFPQARDKALALFEERHPSLLDRVDFGPHRRVSRAVDPGQLSLFEADSQASFQS